MVLSLMTLDTRTLNLIIFGFGIVLGAFIVLSELSKLIDSIESTRYTFSGRFDRIKSHLRSAVCWFLLDIFDIVMFCLWIVTGK